MKKAALLLLLLSTSSAFAQAVEREPLKPFVPYTLQNETDPMALGAPPQDEGNTAQPQRGTGYAPILSSEDGNVPPAPSIDAQQPQSIVPSENAAPSGNGYPPSPAETTYTNAPLSPVQHNVVTATKREDLSKFENRIVCTLKMSFGSGGSGIDKDTAKAAKSYLDGNSGKLSYTESARGNKGDFSYCITVQNHRDQAEIYAGLKRLMPSASSRSGPVTLSGKAFTPVSTVRYQTYRD